MTQPSKRNHDFSPVADDYDRTRAVPPSVVEAAYRLLVAQGDIVPGEPVLEPGCGTGLFTVPFFRLGAAMVGLDISEAMLAIVRDKEPTLPVRLGSVYDIPFPDDTFGAVVVWRVTRPGGSFIELHEHGAFRDSVRREFVRLADEGGLSDRYLGVTEMALVVEYAITIGGRHEPRDTSELSWTKPVRHGDALADHERRLYAEFWPIPDAAYHEMVERVRRRLAEQPDGLQTVETLQPYLSIDVVRWPT